MTGTSPPPQETSPRGYLSEHDKKTFTILTGVLGAVFFFGQFLVPFALMFYVMSGIMVTGFTVSHLDRGASWNGGFWFVEGTETFRREGADNAARLKRIEPGTLEELEEDLPLPSEDLWLLNGVDRLWLISPDTLGYYKDGKIEVEPLQRRIGAISRPFLYQGSPAVVEESPDGYKLRAYASGEWQTKGELSIGLEDRGSCACRLQVVECQGVFHSFLDFGQTLYHHEGIPFRGREGQMWNPVTKAATDWTAVCYAGDPAVFHHEFRPGRVVGLKLSEETWAPFFSYPAKMVTEMGVLMPESSERFALFLQGAPGSFTTVEFEDAQVVRKTRHGSAFPFPAPMMSIMFLPHVGTMLFPFLLAIILSVEMRKHRVCEYRAQAQTVAFAPLWRRAVAQLIDAIVLLAPIAAFVVPPWLGLFEPDSDFPFQAPWVLFGLVFGMLAWMVFGLVVFSFFEGHWGRTPGKWLMGIQVLGIDLAPCGFGRGLIRNALKFVDGFFNYLVGILIVALTENWQRVGDMAARTVVVQVRGKTSDPRSAEP